MHFTYIYICINKLKLSQNHGETLKHMYNIYRTPIYAHIIKDTNKSETHIPRYTNHTIINKYSYLYQNVYSKYIKNINQPILNQTNNQTNREEK